MASSLQSNSHQAGVTLTELLVVILVIATIVGFALMRRGSANEIFTRQNVAQQLKTVLERARFDSVKRRADNIGGNDYRAKVTITPTTYTLRTYNNDVNSMPVASDVVTTLPAGIVIGLYDGTALTSQEVAFDMRGETSASPPPQFYVCNVSCSSPTNTTANILIVTPTGTVNLLPGGSTLPTFGVPAVNPVPVGSAVNPDAVLN